jgi:hypothetical protein
MGHWSVFVQHGPQFRHKLGDPPVRLFEPLQFGEELEDLLSVEP